jgi:serine/threonine-protein kinase
MFHVLSGRWVHEGRTPNEQLLSAMTKPAPPCASAAPRVSPAVAQIVDKALAFERDRRWPDARSMQLAVRQAYRDRHGAAIATAPKLAVPAQVASRTLPSAQGAAAAVDSTTGRPVERGESGAPAGGASAWTPLGVALAIGGAAALGVALTGAVWAVSAGRGTATAGGPSTGLQVVTTLPNPSTMAPAHPAASAPSAAAKDAASEVLPAADSAFRGAGVEQALPATSAKPAPTKTVITGPISPPGPATSTMPPGYRSDVPY